MKELPETTVEQKLVIDALVKNKGTKTLYEQIIAKDEEYKNYISPNDIQRVSRIYSLLFFHNISHSKYLNLPNITNFKSEDFFTIYLNPDRKKLYEKINNRVDQMIKEGLMAEIKAFFKKNYIANNNIYKAIGIKELEGFINSKQYQLEEELYNSGEKQNIEIIELIKKNTRNYAKRQVTFFNHQIKSDLTLENYIGWNG